MGKDKEKFERIDSIKERATCLVESQINGDIQNVDAKELGEIADIVKDMAETKKLCMEAKYYEAVTDAMEEADPEEKKIYMDKYLPEQRMFYGGRFPNYPLPPIMYYRGGNGRGRMRDSRGRFMYDEMMPLDYGFDEWEDYYKPGPPRMYYDDWGQDKMPMYQREYRSEPPYFYGGQNGGMNSGGNGGNRGGNSGGRYYGGDKEQWRDPREGRSGMRRRMYMEMQENGEDEDKKHEELEKYLKELGTDVADMITDASPEDKNLLRTRLTQLIGRIN